VVDVLGVDIGTTDLGNYQSATMANDDGSASTGPLYGLVTPIIVEWKTAGQPVSRYREAGRTGKLPNVSPASPQALYQMEWEWRGGVIFLTPLSYPADLRVRGEFGPPPLVKDTDVLVVHPRIEQAVSYGTAALIGAERNNAPYTENYSTQADRVLENISNMMVKAEQGTTTRIGRVGGHRGGNGFRS
jgi:hypothetical protein